MRPSLRENAFGRSGDRLWPLFKRFRVRQCLTGLLIADDDDAQSRSLAGRLERLAGRPDSHRGRAGAQSASDRRPNGRGGPERGRGEASTFGSEAIPK